MNDLSVHKHDQKLLLEVLGLQSAGNHGHCRFCGSSDALSVFGGESGWAFRCHSCDEKGDVFAAVMKLEGCSFNEAKSRLGCDAAARSFTPITRATSHPKTTTPEVPVPDKEKLYEYSGRCQLSVLDNHPIFAKYANERGVDRDTCGRLGVGFDLGRRMWSFPIAHNEEFVALKLHRGGNDVQQKSGWFSCGTAPPEKPRHGLSTLWPPPEVFVLSETLYICEGELKALAGLCDGMNATSPTSGSGFSWQQWHVDRFKDRDVCLIYDDDKEGEKFRDHTQRKLTGTVSKFNAITFKGGFNVEGN